MRAGLACLLGADQAPQILMVDEPTNNLDLTSIEELVSVLREYRGVLIVVSHDQTVVEEIGVERVFDLCRATRGCAEIRPGKPAGRNDG